MRSTICVVPCVPSRAIFPPVPFRLVVITSSSTASARARCDRTPPRMAAAIFDYREFQQLIERLSAELPSVLASHHTTVNLVPQVVDLLNVAETPFTLAVVGQMRVGKSSLLNALVGAELAVTGVTETTATINWFKHGDVSQSERFRVVWKDRPAEDFPTARSQNGSVILPAPRRPGTSNSSQMRIFYGMPTWWTRPGLAAIFHARGRHTRVPCVASRSGNSPARGAADAILYVLMPMGAKTTATCLPNLNLALVCRVLFPTTALRSCTNGKRSTSTIRWVRQSRRPTGCPLKWPTSYRESCL